MKVWYSKKRDVYAPSKDWFDLDTFEDDDIVEMEINREEIICEGGDDDPYRHGEVWELDFQSEDWMHSMGTKIPWKQGKYRITIEELDEPG
ncbi:MAG: hypothetical protein HWN68_02210 [Desulfobacterales bacterium]|nr:hypothetical protein [Desulfobacterales bacterium]